MKKQKASLGSIAAAVWISLVIVAGPVAAQEFRDYYVTDVVGSPVMATGANTNTTWTEDYLPYGQKRTLSASNSNGGDNERAFTGAVQNELSGLVDFGNRTYDPISGRFLSIDPVGVSVDDGGNFNRYWYANNNPHKFVDPDGRLAWFIPIMIGITWLTAPDAANAPTHGEVPIPRGDAARSGLTALAPLPGASLVRQLASRGVAPNIAARGAIGFAEGTGASAFVANRLQHASRHLTDAGILGNWSKATGQRFIELGTRIVENPMATFNHVLRSGDPVKGFLGQVNGQNVAILIFSRGPRAGQVATAIVPSAQQLANWGL